MIRVQVLRFILGLIFFGAGPTGAESFSKANCPGNQSLEVASVSVGYTYRSSAMNLESGPLNDLKFYNRFADGFTAPTKKTSITDSSLRPTEDKETFLRQLQSRIGSAKYVNFNFSGHGVVQNGKVSLVLPTLPADLMNRCLSKPTSGKRGLARIEADNCGELDKYLVSPEDLKPIFKGKRVFGIIDACHSGGFDLGPDSSMLLASQSEELAGQNDTNTAGAFTAKIQEAVDNPCVGDLDGDQHVSVNELVERWGGSPIVTRTASRGLERRGMKVSSSQHPILNNQEWTSCFSVQNESRKRCSKSFKEGQMATTTAPTTASSTDRGKDCFLPSGTRVQLLETKMGETGRVKAEVPQSLCSFNDAMVPIQFLRGDTGKQVPVIVPAVQDGSTSR